MALIDLVEQVAWTFPDGQNEEPIKGPIPEEYASEASLRREELIEAVGEVDDQMLIAYVEQREVSTTELKKAIRRATITNVLTPALCGTALKNKGIQPLLDAIVDYLPSPLEVPPVSGSDPRSDKEKERRASDEEPFSALAFKVVADPYVGRPCLFPSLLRHGPARSHRFQRRPKREGTAWPTSTNAC